MLKRNPSPLSASAVITYGLDTLFLRLTRCHKKGFGYLNWTKATIKTTTSGIEIVTALLMDLGIFSVEINDSSEMAAFFTGTSPDWDYVDDELLNAKKLTVKNSEASVVFYLGTGSDSTLLLSCINDKIKSMKSTLDLSLHTETVNDQDWQHEWKKYFHPIKIGKVLIAPEWEPVNSSSEIVFTIDPGSAFGTGQHATTMLCIESLQDYIQPGCNVLDIGCGSGILSIISLLLGAKQAIACDIDPSATEVTKKNASLNPIDPDNLILYTGDFISVAKLQKEINCFKYDIVLANIVADVIISLAPLINNLLAPNGVLIASGIIIDRLDDVKSELATNNLSIVQTKEYDGWCLVVANG